MEYKGKSFEIKNFEIFYKLLLCKIENITGLSLTQFNQMFQAKVNFTTTGRGKNIDVKIIYEDDEPNSQK